MEKGLPLGYEDEDEDLNEFKINSDPNSAKQSQILEEILFSEGQQSNIQVPNDNMFEN